jgi:DNA-binding FrmR family transcriptional regulator
MAGVLESHLREEFTHLVETTEAQRSSIDEVVSLVRTYLK